MSSSNFYRSLEHVLVHEGGYVNHPKDPGGATNKGVTQRVYDQFRKDQGAFPQSVKLIADEEVESIYRFNYWDEVRGDKLPSGLDYATFDYAVNSGPSRAAKDLQRVLKADPVDGKIGPKTLAALAGTTPRAAIKALCARRLSFVQSLKIWSTFGKGWSRRIASVEATALSWVSTKAQLQDDVRQAQTNIQRNNTAVVGTAGTGVLDQTTGLSGLPDWMVLVLVAVVIGGFVIRSAVQAQRVSALRLAATKASWEP